VSFGYIGFVGFGYIGFVGFVGFGYIGFVGFVGFGYIGFGFFLFFFSFTGFLKVRLVYYFLNILYL